MLWTRIKIVHSLQQYIQFSDTDAVIIIFFAKPGCTLHFGTFNFQHNSYYNDASNTSYNLVIQFGDMLVSSDRVFHTCPLSRISRITAIVPARIFLPQFSPPAHLLVV